MKREELVVFQGRENVIHIICDNGTNTYLTQPQSFFNEAYNKGACALNTIETETKHVLFLFNSKGLEVGRYYLGKKLQGKTPTEIASITSDLIIFDSWNTTEKKWVPCIGVRDSTSKDDPI